MNAGSPRPSGGGNSKIAGIIVAIIILALIGWFAMSKKSGNNPDNTTKSQTNNSENVPPAGNQPTSLKELLAAGSNQKCEVSFDSQNSQTQGTIYVSGGKYRADFSSIASGKTISSHMITDTQNVYTWMDGMGTGYKMAASSTMNSGAMEGNSQQSIDPNNKYDYNCSGWSVDSSKFDPPSGMTFTDISTMVPGNASSSASGSASMKVQQCAACNSLSGSQKTQCLAALSCP